MSDVITRLTAALRYPWADGDAGVTLVVGGILTLLSPLVLPGLFVIGYGLRVVGAVMGGDEAPPAFGDAGTLLFDGVKGIVVLLAYVVLPLGVWSAVIVAYGSAAGFGLGGLSTIADPFPGGPILAVLVFLLAGLALVVAYLAPAALVHLGRTGRLGAAFAFDDVQRLAGAPAYASAWLLALAVFALTAVVLEVLTAAAIGVIVSGFVTFYGFVAMARLYARGAAEAGFEAAADEADEAGTDAT